MALDLSGQIEVLDWGNKSPSEVDATALRSDWRRVGEDLRRSLEEFESTQIGEK